MDVKTHYDKHLGNFYSWMSGDIETKAEEFKILLKTQKILPSQTKIALDLGAGHGIQSIALSKLGFQVRAIDFNEQLLNELQSNSKELAIEIIKDDMRSVANYAEPAPEIIVCCGDTLTHLADKKEIGEFISNCALVLMKKGKLILSFRDYTFELKDEARFIPVKSDENRILTCFLEYEPSHIKVTDLLHEKTTNGWIQEASAYHKVRIAPTEVEEILRKNQLKIHFKNVEKGFYTVIAGQ